MPEFLGLCGKGQLASPCKIVWNSTYPNKVGTYPSSLLPAARTIWYAAVDWRGVFPPPIDNPLDLLPIGGLLGGSVGGLTQTSLTFGVFTPQTHLAIIFAQTANRLNIPHVLTQSEIDSIDTSGVGKVNVGEYVFEAAFVTDQIEAINSTLTEKDLNDINKTGETESDKAFRKLFEQGIPEARNRFKNISPNLNGIQYRLDNGTPKSSSALGSASDTNVSSANYRDGTSKILLVDLKKITTRVPKAPGDPEPPAGSLQAEARIPKAGDIIYLTYVAIKEHYIRQLIEINWTMFATALPPVCYGSVSSIKAVNYRFFEWQIEPTNDSDPPVIIGGWRVVESFNVPVSCVAALGTLGNIVLGDFLIGSYSGNVKLSYMPADVNESELKDYIANQSLLPTYQVNLNQFAGQANYHINSGAQNNPSAYQNAEWLSRGQFIPSDGHGASISHVFFNVHPKSLLKRDVDKFGIDRTLATEIEKDYKSGKFTFFPFMDDPDVDVPTGGCNDFLSSDNCKFDPVQNVTKYTAANADIDCNVGGAFGLGNTGSGSDNIFAAFGFTSNIITEKFDRETRVLVERHFTSGSYGERFVAIRGQAGGVQSVSCIADPSRNYGFAVHIGVNDFLSFNIFKSGYLISGMRNLTYRPDQTLTVSTNPKPSDYQNFLGYNGLLGDIPSFYPGQLVNTSVFSKIENFKYKTTSRVALALKHSNVTNDQITEITLTKNEKLYSAQLGSGYYGRTEIYYKSSVASKMMLVFKNGDDVSSTVDLIDIQPTDNQEKFLQLDHKWMYGSTLNISLSEDITIVNATFLQLSTTKSTDFLENASSSQDSEKNQLLDLKFLDNNVFFETDVVSIGEDQNSKLYVFFNDKNDGISCSTSNTYGRSWDFHYGIIEPINQSSCKYPFVVNSHESNLCYLFFMFMNKIFCKKINYKLFMFEDAFLIEKYDTDVFTAAAPPATLPKEKSSVYSNNGVILRRKIVSNLAAGNYIDTEFLSLIGKNLDTGVSEPTEKRFVETKKDNTTVTTVESVRKNPLAVGVGTVFNRYDISDSSFSAYINDQGMLKLFFLSPTQSNPGNFLQCHCSSDSISWIDLLEFVEHNNSRVQYDEQKNTTFIGVSNGLSGTDPLLIKNAEFGINIHWSRLQIHKADPSSSDPLSESTVLDVKSPYVFYQPTTRKVYLFYIYNGCLLCKIFSDTLFDEASSLKQQDDNLGGISYVKHRIEVETMAYFVDGNLTGDIRKEIQRYKDDNIPVVTNGNIIFQHQFSINQFNDSRNISGQRVCAYELYNGNIRVLYKNDETTGLKASIWTGSQWYVEDFMKQSDNLEDIDLGESDG